MSNPTISKGYTWANGATVMPSRLNQEVDAATLNFTKTNVLAGRQTSGAGVAEEIDISATGFSLIAAANAAAMRVVLAVVIGTDVQAYDSDLAAIAALATTSFGRSLLTQADAAAARSTLGAGTSSFDGAFSSLSGKPTTLSGYGITDAQPLDSDLTAIAALATTSFGRAFLTLADASAARTAIGIGSNAIGNRTVSTSAPSGGSDGDTWLQV